MIPVEQQKDPRNDIGPVYKAMAGIGLGLAFIVLIIQALKGHSLGLHDGIFIGIMALLCLGLWRPDGFDELVKQIANHLPNLPFTTREVSQQETSERPAVKGE